MSFVVSFWREDVFKLIFKAGLKKLFHHLGIIISI